MEDNKLLIVEDNTNNIRLLAEILEDAGYSIFVVNNGLHVLEVTRLLKPSVVLLDVMMPGLNGFEVCEQLKLDSCVQDIPVIMVTAKTEGKDVSYAFEKGAFDYIKKPIDEAETLARVKAAIRYKQLQDELKEMAMRDSLTGLYNHALLKDLLEKEIKRQERQGGALAFAMLDIDYFKSVNDGYGHALGDVVLKELGNILSSEVRASDIVGRYGGEEFGLVLSEISLDELLSLCERIRRTIQEHSFSLTDENIKITVSIGVYYKHAEEQTSLNQVIQCADRALYYAKNKGRNRIELYLNDY